MSAEEYLLFWTNFKEYIKVNHCQIEFKSPSRQYFQMSNLKGYDLKIDLCASLGKSVKNKWNTRVELYGIKDKKEKQFEKYNYFKNQLDNMRKALPDYEIDFRLVKEDENGISWKLYIGTNDLILRKCDNVEIYKYYVKVLNRMAEAWKPFFELYKK